MRLCYIGNPASIHTQRWVTHFAARGHAVFLINWSAQPNTRFDWPGPTHRNVPIPPAWPIPGVRGIYRVAKRLQALKQTLQEIQPDILHAHYISDPSWFAALSGFHPLVLTAWGSDILLGLQQAPIYQRWLTRFALSKADALTADAQLVLDRAKPHLRAGAIAALIRFGVDTQRFSPAREASLRDKFGLQNKLVVLSIRQCQPLYNIDVIVKAFAGLHETMPNAHLLIKLVGQSDHDVYVQEIKRLCGNLGITNAVTFIPHVDYAEMPDLYRTADVVVSVPSSDGMPASVLEAMACGTAAVVSNLPALAELQTLGADLSTVPVRDADALKRALQTLLADPTRREKMTTHNVEIVQREGNFDVEMEKMRVVYEEILSRRAGKS